MQQTQDNLNWKLQEFEHAILMQQETIGIILQTLQGLQQTMEDSIGKKGSTQCGSNEKQPKPQQTQNR